MIPPKIQRAVRRLRVALAELPSLLPTHCQHCQEEIGDERVTLVTHRDGLAQTFCDMNCLVEFMWDEKIKDEIDLAVRRETNWLHKNVCPACKQRLR